MITTLTRLLCALLLAPFSGVTLSQPAQEERWYKVELLIFSRAQHADQETETWDPTPTLEYPSNYQFLVDPDKLIIAEVEIDPNQVNPEPNQPIEVIEETDTPARPTPFTLLAESEMMFQSKARKMERSGQYKILFHENWLHPMADKATATDIVLDYSGDNAQWPELQGSIKFYISRYLHVETNLWLNTDGHYLPQGWQMPTPPLGPVSHVIYDLDLMPNLDEIDVAIDLEVTEKPPFAQGEERETPELAAAEPPPVYLWRHALLLEQNRRMRSTEVHYIDHPALGVVILITPVEEEELILRAEQEAAQTLL
jgi:hypothetical protein